VIGQKSARGLSPHSHLALRRFLFVIGEEILLLALVVQIRRPAVGHAMTVAAGAVHADVAAILSILARSRIGPSGKDVVVIRGWLITQIIRKIIIGGSVGSGVYERWSVLIGKRGRG